jgi:phosphoglycolate phosphatase-like HAD superfamily hydrolase
LGIARDAVRFGPLAVDECARLGVTLDDYLAAYDVNAAPPYDGVVELLDALVARGVRWAVCSNKIRRYGVAELERLGWRPEVALFADDFAGAPKSVAPVLAAMGGVAPSAAVFVGDTAHDRTCALDAGVRFALAGWNPRAVGEGSDAVLAAPADLLRLL